MNLKLLDLNKNDLPREKAILHGIKSLATHELLAILLRTGYKQQNVLQLAYEVLAFNNGLIGLSRLDYQELKEIKGLKKAKALSLMAAFELAKRLNDYSTSDVKINSPEAIFSFFNPKLKYESQERFYVVFLNTKNIMTSYKELFVGGLDRSIVHARDIFRESVKNNAAKIILIHNHPSGDPTPSEADIHITKELIEAGEIIGITIIDHIIIGSDSYVSLRAIHAI